MAGMLSNLFGAEDSSSTQAAPGHRDDDNGADPNASNDTASADAGSDYDNDLDVDLDLAVEDNMEVIVTLETAATWTDGDGVGQERGNSTTLSTGETDIGNDLGLGF